jgi:ABC-type oligopeptide transport system substrate-binding subunit
LSECGIRINIKAVPSEIYWDVSHEDSIFQGHFDLAQISWVTPITNPCLLFSSQFIPSPDNKNLGTNFSGYINQRFDAFCDLLMITHLNTSREALIKKMEMLINDDLPAIPLYSYSKLIIAQKNFCVNNLNTKSENELAHIEEFVISANCS